MRCSFSSRRGIVFALAGLGLAGPGLIRGARAADPLLDPLDPLRRPAAASRKAASAVIIGAARAAQRVVVVGEGGTVLLSDDAGAQWQQAAVPVSVTLTSVSFVDAQRGWAVGHSGVILATTDGGKTWTKQIDASGIARPAGGAAGGAGDPLLDVHFTDASNGLAVGAFGLALRTRDGGKTWAPWRDHLPNADGNHLYAIRAVGGKLFVVGERGSIYASSDHGETFASTKSPYEGSFFGLTGTQDGGLLVYGLRGNAFQSPDLGQTWTKLSIDGISGSAWLGGSALSDGRTVLVSQAGEVAVAEAGTSRFALLSKRFPPLNAVVDAGNSDLVVVGMRGTQRLVLNTKRG